MWNIFAYKKGTGRWLSGQGAYCAHNLILDSQHPGEKSSMDWCVSSPRDAREGCGRNRDGGPMVSQSSQNRLQSFRETSHLKKIRCQETGIDSSAPYTPPHRQVHTSMHTHVWDAPAKERTKIKLTKEILP